MSDLMSILRGNIKYPFGIPNAKRNKIKNYDLNNYENSLYIRFEVKDKPGVLSQITKNLANNKISVQRLLQIPNNRNKTASIVIITHTTKQMNSDKCLKSLQKNKNVIKKPVLLRLF
jgi:homoserine dehydrogenase